MTQKNLSFQCEKTREIEFYFLISAYFLFRITWGTDNNFISLNLGIIQILTAIYAFAKYQVSRKAFIILIFIFSGLLALQAYYPFVISDARLPGDDGTYFFAAFKLLIYLFFLCLHGLTIRPNDLKAFGRAFLNLARISVVIATLSVLLYDLTGTAVLLNFYISEQLVRPQAFLSEPSAFAPVASVLVTVGFFRRSWRDFFLGVLGLLLPLSPIVMLSGVTSFAVYGFIFEIRRRSVQIAILGLFLILLYLLFTADCGPLVISDEALPRTWGRLSCGVQVIFDPVLRESLQGVFLNLRLVSTIISMDLLRNAHALFTGFGMNSSSIFMPMLYGDTRENSLWISIILFYGIGGVGVFLVLCLCGLMRLKRVDKSFAAFFISILVASTINSAGGFYLYGFIFWGLGFLLSPMPGQRLKYNRPFEGGITHRSTQMGVQ